MTLISRFAMLTLLAAASLAMLPPARAAGGGSMGGGGMSSMPEARERTPDEQARDRYNDGVRLIRKADDADATAQKTTDAAKRQKLQDRASEYYRKALARFEDAVQLSEGMYQAWNYIGYANRHLGEYTVALSAYDRALTLQPGYPEAIEYRGHAYLALNRLDDARNAYLALFPSNRKLADQLLAGMQAFVAARRSDAQGLDAAALDAFAKWVEERVSVSAQTAALTRSGAGAGWR
jgi:tetratricopeptide (TPR) repeat protein